MTRAVNLESIDKNHSRPNSSSTSGMNYESEPVEIGKLRWRQRAVYRQLPRGSWYPPHRPAIPPPRRGPSSPQGYSVGHFAPPRRPWSNYIHPPLQGYGNVPPGYGSSPPLLQGIMVYGVSRFL